MAVTAKLFGNFMLKALNKEIDWDGDTFKVMLCTSTYVPNQDTHIYKSSVTNEVTGTGYTSGGAILGSVTITYNSTTHAVILDAADVSWTSSTITARYAVVYDNTPSTDATRPLVCWLDFGQDFASNVGTFSITWDSAGIASLASA